MSSAQHDPPRNDLADAARHAAVWALVVLGIGVVAVGIWKLRLVVALVFLGFVLAAAMRPGVEALARRRVPRGAGVAIRYLAVVGLIALFAWLGGASGPRAGRSGLWVSPRLRRPRGT